MKSVGNKVRHQVGRWERPWARVHDRMCKQARAEIISKVADQVGGQVYVRVWGKVKSLTTAELKDQRKGKKK